MIARSVGNQDHELSHPSDVVRRMLLDHNATLEEVSGETAHLQLVIGPLVIHRHLAVFLIGPLDLFMLLEAKLRRRRLVFPAFLCPWSPDMSTGHISVKTPHLAFCCGDGALTSPTILGNSGRALSALESNFLQVCGLVAPTRLGGKDIRNTPPMSTGLTKQLSRLYENVPL